MRNDVIDLTALAESLTGTQIVEMLARRILRGDSPHMRGEMKQLFNDGLKMLTELPVRDAFSRENHVINGNIEGLIELRGCKTLPYKYLKFEYTAVNYLVELGFVTITLRDDYYRDTITGTQKLEDFMAPYEDDGMYPFGSINSDIIEMVLEMNEEKRKELNK